jgi:hypothetical protein
VTGSGDESAEPLAPAEQEVLDGLLAAHDDWHAAWTRRHESPPDLLHHYTDAAGLLGIVQDGEIWASNAAFLNDSTELVYVNEVRRSVTADLEARYKKREIIYVEGLLDAMEGIDAVDVFVSCFCQDRDLLSQWRGYPPAGGGYSIGFRSAQLEKHPPLLRKVVYKLSEQAALVTSLLTPLCEAITASADPMRLIETVFRHRVLANIVESVSELGWSFKHPGFSEEEEWRLVTLHHRPRLPHETERLKFRASVTRLVPYIETPITIGAEGSIAEVVVGPNAHPDLAKRAAEELLACAGCDATEMVKHSAVPLRA